MRFRILALELLRNDQPMRLPFRFGAVTLRAATMLTLRATIVADSDTERVHGFAAELCVPKWFDKNPATTPAEDVVALLAVARVAADAYLRDAVGSTAFGHWRCAYDALTASSIDADARLDDGPPQALDEDIRRYGLRYFKLKIGAGPPAVFDRLVAIAEVVRREVEGAAVRVTRDGNEQHADLEALAELIDLPGADERGRYLLDARLYVEQPLPRAMTFDPDAVRGLPRIAEFAPGILDEADSGIDSFPRAHALGHRGVSAKNCKGVFRALAHRGLRGLWNDGSFQAAEDLTNVGVLALQQNLATVAALGLPHVERNGHHYFRGLAHLPASEIAAARARHETLYDALGSDNTTLAIRDGMLDLPSIQCVGYGYDVPIDVKCRDPIRFSDAIRLTWPPPNCRRDAHRRAIGSDFDCVAELRSDGALARACEVPGLGRIGNRFAIEPMEGRDGNADRTPSELTLRGWRNFACRCRSTVPRSSTS